MFSHYFAPFLFAYMRYAPEEIAWCAAESQRIQEQQYSEYLRQREIMDLNRLWHLPSNAH